ncbi:DUF411 domain-containing protein [Colwellia sp. MB3u-70]|uniref:DUF411 domain-containing protein n=1 Tax=unclassified Colwellia TaxID=196834 RepID=UPI0015F3DABF|nr:MULTISPECIES: DUF411 domain-containing protein [unclassified Colwellia]MBA6291180.1 DUF411 domain-containing protein [Colwellia sp. MB3u-8]MBA6305905.1 DUF411 domain-containing protein [Colwellia sp. MB3u-70]
MFSNKFTLNLITTLVVVCTLASCSDKAALAIKTDTSVAAKTQKLKLPSIALDVYKSPNCGCCKKWLSHINDNGFESKVYSNDDFSVIKNEKGIAPRYRSCHTAISRNGYVFEGHVPAKFIQQFMQATQAVDVIGLSVPAMPVGSPGMEVDDKFQPYRILLLKSDGTSEVYAHVQSYKEQF